jgi:hypothetical protein
MEMLVNNTIGERKLELKLENKNRKLQTNCNIFKYLDGSVDDIALRPIY